MSIRHLRVVLLKSQLPPTAFFFSFQQIKNSDCAKKIERQQSFLSTDFPRLNLLSFFSILCRISTIFYLREMGSKSNQERVALGWVVLKKVEHRNLYEQHEL